MQSVCKVRSRLEGFLGPFFLATAGILATGLQRPRRPRRHRASRGFMAAQASTAAQGFTRLHGGTGHHEASRGFTAAQGITAPLKASQASWHPQGLLSGPASAMRHWSFTLRPRTLARGLKGFCGFCAGSVSPRHSPPYSSPERPTGIHWRQERLRPQRESGAIRSQRTGESADDAAAPAQTCA